MRDDGHYRMTPVLVARLAAGPLVALGGLVVVVGVVVALAGWPRLTVALVAGAGLAGVLGYAGWLRWGADLVRLDDTGYRIRFLRDLGPRAGAWTDVRQAVAASPGGVPCLLLHRHDGQDTVLPVGMLDADRDRFAEDVVARLEAAAASDSSRSQGA